VSRTTNERIQVSRSFEAVWCEGTSDRCPNPKWHFHGCAREVFSYLELIRSRNNHGGFLFMRIDDIVAHTKDWSKGGKPFKRRQVTRVLATLRQLCIIGNYETRMIKGRAVSGWQMAPHGLWAETKGGVCDFKHWPDFEPRQRELMGNQQDDSHNDMPNDTSDDMSNDTDVVSDDMPNDTPESVVITSK
jgi:hypothetical protein